jgi:hypothetical protein
MAVATQTSNTNAPLSDPGIVIITSTSPANPPLSIPSFAQGKCTAAWSFKSLNPSSPQPYLALYAIPNVSSSHNPFNLSNNHHSALLSEQSIQKSDIRHYKRIQLFSKPAQTGSKTGIGAVIKCTAIQPTTGTEADFDQWYREEHLEQVSQMPGWRKSTRYELISSNDSADADAPPRYLAIHEFEAGTEVKRMKKEEWTEWTKRMVASAVKIEEATFGFVCGMGGEEAEL